MLGCSGRGWVAVQVLPDDERLAIERHVRAIDRLGEDLMCVERDLAQIAVASEATRRLMTITSVEMIVAEGLMAAIGDPVRFATPQKLVSYLGFNMSVRQSGAGSAYHGRIA
jgi:transposase